MNLTVSQVFQEIRDGHGISLSDAARQFNVNPATVFRWCRDGVRGPDGIRVRLEFCRVGAKLLTSGPGLERYVMSLSDPGHEHPAPRSPSTRRRASESAARELELAGV